MKNNLALKLSIVANVILVLTLVFLTYLKNSNWSTDKNNASYGKTTTTICDLVVENQQNPNIEAYAGKTALVDFESNPDAKLFRTTITAQVAEGANFAGHYSIATWGCGMNCQGYAIVDVIDGEIVEYVPYNKFSAITGISGSINSNILVFNPRVRTDKNDYQSNGYKEERTIEKILNDESTYEAGYGRFYYELSKDYDGKPYLYPICIENFFDGTTK